MILNKKIPTILGILIILSGIGAGVYLVGKKQIFKSKASPGENPKKIRITNVNDSSFTVSWITDEANVGFVRYGPTFPLETTMIDNRDQVLPEPGNYKTHYVSIDGLKAATKYYFRIGSRSSLYDNNGEPYEVITASSLGDPPPADITHGQVLDENAKGTENTIVYLELAGSVPLSSLTQKDGSWTVLLSLSVSSNLASYSLYDPSEAILEIFVQGEDKTATAITNTKNDSPVPTITLGKTHDFRTIPSSQLLKEPEAPQATQSPQPSPKLAESLPTQPLGSPFPLEQKVTLENPSHEGEKVNTLRPEFLGKGPPRKVLTVNVQSPQGYNLTVTVDENGNWRFVPPQNLSPGEHTITISYVDDQGEEKSLSRKFTVLAAGESQIPAFEATPSATMTPSPSPSPTPTPSPIPSPPPRVSQPSTQAGVSQPGTVAPTFFVFLAGIVFCTLGFLTKILQRKTYP